MNAEKNGSMARPALAFGARVVNAQSVSNLDGHHPAKPLILVVDDFEDNRAMYAEFLVFSGYRVEQASNGQEAVDMATSLTPDVVVMDLSLPVMDGWEATRVLKKDARTKDIPVIVLTGHALAGHSRGAMEAGCDDFLAKPCLPEKLLEKVQELLEKRNSAA